MKKNTTSMVLGILFGIGMAGLSYFNLVLTIAFAFANKGAWFGYTPYVYVALGVISIIGAAFARKNIMATRIMLLIPNIIHIALIVYILAVGILTNSFGYLILYLAVAVLGLLSLLFAFLARNRDDYQSPPPSFTPPSQSAQM